MPSLKDVKLKIVGVGKTKQITRAMNMVASAKLRGAQGRIERFRPYATKYRQVIGELAEKASGVAHPLLTPHESKKNCGIVLITSDRGLCGGYNGNLISRALTLARQKKDEGMNVVFDCIGRKGRDAVRLAGHDIKLAFTDKASDPEFPLAVRVGQHMVEAYAQEELDEVWLVYGEFVSISRQPPVALQLLPLSAPALEKADTGPQCEYLYEPSESALLTDLLPKYVNVQIYRGLLDNAASENAARMAAMDNATRNCNDLINSLTLLYNKTRQASITSELIDIVGGAEALNG